MISSSSEDAPCILDTMLIVYSLLEEHPASGVCEQFIRSRDRWHTSPLVLFEAKAVLAKVYGVAAVLASDKLRQLSQGPLVVMPLDAAVAIKAFDSADERRIDLTDAALLQAAHILNAGLIATDDGRLATACRSAGFTVGSPIDSLLRSEITRWEEAQLPTKGLPRVLHRVHQWLQATDPEVASDFWSACGWGSHLP